MVHRLVVDPLQFGDLRAAATPFASVPELLTSVAEEYLQVVTEILERRELFDVRAKPEDGSVVSTYDMVAHAEIANLLNRLTPGAPILSEEAKHETPEKFFEKYKDEPYVWVVDPFDGSQNLIQGSPCFASSIALCARREDELIPIAASVMFPGYGVAVVCDDVGVKVLDLAKTDDGVWSLKSRAANEKVVLNPVQLQKMSLLSSYDFSKRFEIDPDFSPAVRILRATVVDFVSVATGVPEGWGVGAFTYAKIWDIAAGMAIGRHVGLELGTYRSERTLDGLRAADFFDSTHNRWGVSDPVILAHPQNLPFIRSIVREHHRHSVPRLITDPG